MVHNMALSGRQITSMFSTAVCPLQHRADISDRLLRLGSWVFWGSGGSRNKLANIIWFCKNMCLREMWLCELFCTLAFVSDVTLSACGLICQSSHSIHEKEVESFGTWYCRLQESWRSCHFLNTAWNIWTFPFLTLACPQSRLSRNPGHTASSRSFPVIVSKVTSNR